MLQINHIKISWKYGSSKITRWVNLNNNQKSDLQQYLSEAFKIRLINAVLKFTTCVIYVIQVVINSSIENE